MRGRNDDKFTSSKKKKRSQTHGHRKIPLALLSVSKPPSGLVSKTRRYKMVFLSWWKKIHCLTNHSPLPHPHRGCSLALKFKLLCQLLNNWLFSKISNPCVTVSCTGWPFVIGHTARHQVHWWCEAATSLQISCRGSPCGVMAKVLDCSLEVMSSNLICIHFWTNTLVG